MARSCKTYRFWTAAELDKLEELVGQTTFESVCYRWNYWASREGLPPRSTHSLARKARKMGWTRFAWGDLVLTGDVARLLGKHRSTVQEWVRQGWITRHGSGRASALSRLELRQLARRKPQVFGGVPRGALVQLLELEELADWILEQAPKRWQSCRNSHRVRWVDRGLVFNSYGEAGRAAHVNGKAIRNAIAEGRLVCGMRFERA